MLDNQLRKLTIWLNLLAFCSSTRTINLLALMHGCEELSQPYQSQPASTSSGSDMKAAGSPISFPIPTSLGQEIDEDPEVALETLPGITTDFGEEFSSYEELLIPASPLLRSWSSSQQQQDPR